ncbi:MAG TPA: hypothetical protein VGB65_11440 [Allosphingosinicella sp.]|jgi:hypothetical protein
MRSLILRAAAPAAALAAFAAPAAAPAQIYLNQPDFKPGPIEGSDPLVGLPIPGANPAEYRSHLLWNLRSGLNVAALQCQFSPYLRTVSNYNGILAHHSVELASAYTTLIGYFKRVHGAVKGQKLFDDYSTATYNNFSTFHAQFGFCQVAADISKYALTKPKGQLITVARERVRELRNSLIPVTERPPVPFNPWSIQLVSVPPLSENCWKKDQLVPNCAASRA